MDESKADSVTVMIIKNLIILIIVGMLFTAACGQDKPAVSSVSLDKIKSTYENNQYQEVEQLIKTELDLFPQQSPQSLAILLHYLALSQASQGKEEEAQNTFASLLLIKPDYRIDTSVISPKLQLLFGSVMLDSLHSTSSSTISPSYLIQTDRRSEYILKSIVFPGWGQLQQGQKRGYLWGTLFSVAILGSGVSTYMAYQTKVDYLNVSDQQEIESAYNEFNQWYRLRNTFLTVTFATYTLNLADISRLKL